MHVNSLLQVILRVMMCEVYVLSGFPPCCLVKSLTASGTINNATVSGYFDIELSQIKRAWFLFVSFLVDHERPHNHFYLCTLFTNIIFILCVCCIIFGFCACSILVALPCSVSSLLSDALRVPSKDLSIL